MRLGLIAFICATALGSQAYAGAWLQAEDALFLDVSQSYFTSNEYFDVQASKTTTLPYEKYETSIYAEYGLSKDITLGGRVAYATARQQFTNNAGFVFEDANRILIDPEFFFRGGLWEWNGGVLSGEVGVKLPSQYEQQNGIFVGSDSRDLSLSLNAGHSFKLLGNYHFIEGRAGIRFREDTPGNQAHLDGRLGLRPFEDVLLMTSLYTTWAEDIPDSSQFLRSGAQDYDLIKGELAIWYDMEEDYSLHLSVSSHLRGKNTGDGEAVTTGIAYTF